MAQYGEDYGRQTDEYGNPSPQTDEYGNPIRQTDEYGNPVRSHTGGTMEDFDPIRQTDEYGSPIRQTDEYGNPVGSHTGGTMEDFGTTGTYAGRGAGTDSPYAGAQQPQHDSLSGMLHTSGSSSSSEDDGQGGRRKKKGLKEKIKEKLPGGGQKDHQDPDTATTTAEYHGTGVPGVGGHQD